MEDEAEQVKLLEEAVDTVLSRNRQKARSARHPLTYEEIRLCIRGFLNGKGKHEPGLFGESSNNW